ncbi:glycosyltransferase family 9 protein [Asticcacaulis sp. EMRT-3]|uniref:glycosyltransferase family 9 protein n=1 Tax=Asticcacaulis sp. EMRT-3 TaxID=3040349 RepID=UPI0024AFF39B|nr:glycosyltransferase family 9 protein [Asticcacaulis sp. EMRT-3]MDI7774893.1 glycosyltransferase family 9 protein [Asticcacaulis sp. EMRT-3]
MTKAFPILLLAFCEPARALSLGGVITRLKQEIPHARITLATTPFAAELFQDDDSIAEIQALDGAIFNLRSLGSLSELSRRKWGLCIDLGPSMIARMMKAKTRFSFNPNDSASALTQICRALHLDEAEVYPGLRVSPRREARVRGLIDNGREAAPFIIMAPGAGWLGRRWPTERFAVLAARLTRKGGLFAGHRLLVIGHGAEHDTLMALSLATTRAQVLETSDSIDALNLYAALRHAKLFVGNDEIWLHLAAAAHIPAIGLYGPSDEAEGPAGPNVRKVRGPRSLDEIRLVDPKLKQNACHMLDLPVDKVYDSILTAIPKNEETSDGPDI